MMKTNMTQQQCKEYLAKIGYGDKRDYRKIILQFNIATTWAKNLKVAAIGYKAKYGVDPDYVGYSDSEA